MSALLTSCFSDKSRRVADKKRFSARTSVVQNESTYEEDPNMAVWSEQFSSGDQTEDARQAFWNSGFALCYKCGSRDLETMEEKAGVRMNGDSYGTEVYTCKACKWETSYQFDDASDESWHYETIGWPRGIKHFPVSYMKLWAEKHQLSNSFREKIQEHQLTGDKLLELLNSEELQKSVGVDKKSLDKIKKVQQSKLHAVLKQL